MTSARDRKRRSFSTDETIKFFQLRGQAQRGESVAHARRKSSDEGADTDASRQLYVIDGRFLESKKPRVVRHRMGSVVARSESFNDAVMYM